jgi:hypothetical protein
VAQKTGQAPPTSPGAEAVDVIEDGRFLILVVLMWSLRASSATLPEVRAYKVFCETRGHTNPGCPWEKEGVMYPRQFVVTAEDEDDAIVQARRMTDVGPYTGENFKAVPLCLRCHGSGRLQREDFGVFFERFKALPKHERLAYYEEWKAESLPCPECQN